MTLIFFCPEDGFVAINHQGRLVSANLPWKTESEFYVYQVYRTDGRNLAYQQPAFISVYCVSGSILEVMMRSTVFFLQLSKNILPDYIHVMGINYGIYFSQLNVYPKNVILFQKYKHTHVILHTPKHFSTVSLFQKIIVSHYLWNNQLFITWPLGILKIFALFRRNLHFEKWI